jgi:hypothetical protein
LNQAYPLPLDAQFTLSFSPNAAGLPITGNYSSRALQFASGGKSTTVTVQPNNTSWPIPPVQIGDVAGTISVTLVSVRVSVTGQALQLPSSPPFASITVPRLAPTITPGSLRITNVTTTGFIVEVAATSTPRDLASAIVNFTAAPGTQLTGTGFTVPLSETARAWFESAAGQDAGGAFDLKIPFPFSGDPKVIGSVSVTLTNSIGSSVTGTI